MEDAPVVIFHTVLLSAVGICDSLVRGRVLPKAAQVNLGTVPQFWVTFVK